LAIAGVAILVGGFMMMNTTNDVNDEAFQNFISTYRRSYFSKDEYNLRKLNFENTLRLIDERNAKDTATHGITQFADWSE